MALRKPKNGGLSSALVSVEGYSSAQDAVELACELIGGQKGALYIVYVIEVERSLPLDSEIVAATAKGEEVLKAMERIADPFKCDVHAELLQSRRAGLAIVQEAAEKQVDAIVLGANYATQYGSFSLGETVPYVLSKAPCKVILWRNAVSQDSVNGGG